MSLKNLWSLNIDEALVANELKSHFAKTDYEVFFPLNSQMKDIDLLLIRLKDYKTTSIQVKGSRTFPPNPKQVAKYGSGGTAWFRIAKNSIFKPKNKVSFYIFVAHSVKNEKNKKDFAINYFILPASKLKEMAKKKINTRGEFLHFYIWVDSNAKKAFDYRDLKYEIDLSKYRKNWDLLK